MRNYTGLAVWGCLSALLALEFIDFGSPAGNQTAKSGSIRPEPAAVPSALPAYDGKAKVATVAKTGALDRRRRESLHVPFAHIREKSDGTMSYRQ